MARGLEGGESVMGREIEGCGREIKREEGSYCSIFLVWIS